MRSSQIYSNSCFETQALAIAPEWMHWISDPMAFFNRRQAGALELAWEFADSGPTRPAFEVESWERTRESPSPMMNIFSSGKSDRKQRRADQFQGPTSGSPSNIPTEQKQNKSVQRRKFLKWLGFGTAVTATQYLHKDETPSPSIVTTRESMTSEDRAVLEEITRQLREATDRYYAEMRRLAHLNQSFNQLKPLADIVGQAIVNIFTSHQTDTQMPEIGEAMARWRQEGKLTHMDLLDMVAVLERYFARHHQVFVVGPVETDIDGYFIPGFYQVMLAERVAVPGGEWTHSPVPGNGIDAEEVGVGRESISFLTPLAAFSIRKAWGRTRPLIVYRIPSLEEDVETLRQLTRRHPTRLSLMDSVNLIRAERYEELTDHIMSDLVHADFNRLPTENAEAFRALVLPAIRRVTGLHEWGHLAEPEGANAQTSKEAMREATDHEVLAYWQELGYSGFPCLSIQSLFGAASIEPGQTLQARSQNPHFVAAGEYFNLLADVIHSDRQTFSMISVDVPPDIANDPQKVMFFYLVQLASIPRDLWIALGKHPIARGPMGSNVKPPGTRGESSGPEFYSHWAAGIGVIKPSQTSPAAPDGGEKTGGAWSPDPAYVPKAWRETPITLGITLAAVAGLALGHALGWHSAGLWIWSLFPASFYLGHVFKNRPAMGSREVLELTMYKSLAAIAAAAMSWSGWNPLIVASLVAAAAVAITIRHWWIQRTLFTSEHTTSTTASQQEGSKPSDPYRPFWVKVANALPIAENALQALKAETNETTLRLYWQAVEDAAKAAEPFRAFIVENGEQVIPHGLRPTTHAFVQIPNTPFSDRERDAIETELTYLESRAETTLDARDGRRFVDSVVPLNLHFIAGEVLRTLGNPIYLFGVGLRQPKEIGESLLPYVNMLASGRGITLERRDNSPTTIAVATGLSPELAAAIAAHEAAHQILARLLPFDQLNSDEMDIVEIVPEAVLMLSLIRQNSLDVLSNANLYGLSLPEYRSYRIAYEIGREAALEFSDVLSHEIALSNRLQALELATKIGTGPSLRGAALAADAEVFARAQAERMGRASDHEYIIDTAYRYVLHFAKNRGHVLRRTIETVEQMSKESALPSSGNLTETGGSWSLDPAYVPKAWRETPITLGITLLAVAGLAVGHALGWHQAGLWIWSLFPASFYLGHVFKNLRAMVSPEVLELTGYKSLAAIAAAAMFWAGWSPLIVGSIVAAAAVAISFRHWAIQNSLSSLPPATPADDSSQSFSSGLLPVASIFDELARIQEDWRSIRRPFVNVMMDDLSRDEQQRTLGNFARWLWKFTKSLVPGLSHAEISIGLLFGVISQLVRLLSNFVYEILSMQHLAASGVSHGGVGWELLSTSVAGVFEELLKVGLFVVMYHLLPPAWKASHSRLAFALSGAPVVWLWAVPHLIERGFDPVRLGVLLIFGTLWLILYLRTGNAAASIIAHSAYNNGLVGTALAVLIVPSLARRWLVAPLIVAIAFWIIHRLLRPDSTGPSYLSNRNESERAA